MGVHSSEKVTNEFWKSNTVSHAEVGAKKAEMAVLKTAADFNKE